MKNTTTGSIHTIPMPSEADFKKLGELRNAEWDNSWPKNVEKSIIKARKLNVTYGNIEKFLLKQFGFKKHRRTIRDYYVSKLEAK